MKYLMLLLSGVLLSGCVLTSFIKPPVFPDPVPELMAGCEDLSLVPENTSKLSETVVVVTENYSKYHVCRAKADAWVQWYNEQKKIHNQINK